MLRKFLPCLAAAGAVLAAGSAHAAYIIAAGSPGATGASALYMSELTEISSSQALTPAQFDIFLGDPDGEFQGLGAQSITYDLGLYRLTDGAGQDFNVYDAAPESWGEVDILVSANGINFFNVESSRLGAVDVAGDEDTGTNGVSIASRQSFDVSAAAAALGTSQFRYVRIAGTGAGSISGPNGFDLDGVAFVNYDLLPGQGSGAVPEPSTWAMMLLGFGGVGACLRRRRVAVPA